MPLIYYLLALGCWLYTGWRLYQGRRYTLDSKLALGCAFALLVLGQVTDYQQRQERLERLLQDFQIHREHGCLVVTRQGLVIAHHCPSPTQRI